MNALMPPRWPSDFGTMAITTTTSAIAPLVAHSFVPVEDVAVARSGSAVAPMPRRVGADVGLGEQERARCRVVATRGQPLALLLLGAEHAQRLGHADRLVGAQQRARARRATRRPAPARGCSRPARARARRTPPTPSSRARRAASGPRRRASGIFASRSISSGSTSFSRNSRRRARKRSPLFVASASRRGCGWIRSSRKRPRNSSLPKLGSVHSCSRAASATWRASFSLTLTSWPCAHHGGERNSRRL